MTVTRRKSMYEVRLRFAFGERAPCPMTFLQTNLRGTFFISERPGGWMTWACGLCLRLFVYRSDMTAASLTNRERHVEHGHVARAARVLAALELHRSLRHVERVEHTDDDLELLVVAD